MDQRASTVSVILPLYNCEQYVATAVESVLQQDYGAVELIVVDDGSTDSSVQTLGPYLSRLRLITQRNGGAAAARNAGMTAATGKFVAFIDADDLWASSKLSLQLEVFERFPEVGAVFSDFSVIDQSGGVQLASRGIHWKYRTLREASEGWHSVFDAECEVLSGSDAPLKQPVAAYAGRIFPRLFHGNLINTSSIMLRREVIETTGLFDTTLSTEEDYEYWLRVSGFTCFAFIDAPLVAFRRRAGQLTRQDQIETILRNVDTVLRRFAPTARQMIGPKPVQRRLARVDRDIGELCLRTGRGAEARQRLLRSLLADPLRPSTLAILGLAVLPNRAYHVAYSTARRIRRL